MLCTLYDEGQGWRTHLWSAHEPARLVEVMFFSEGLKTASVTGVSCTSNEGARGFTWAHVGAKPSWPGRLPHARVDSHLWDPSPHPGSRCDFGSQVLTVDLWPVSLTSVPFDGLVCVFSSDVQATIWGVGWGQLLPGSNQLWPERGQGSPVTNETACGWVPEASWDPLSFRSYFPPIVYFLQLNILFNLRI